MPTPDDALFFLAFVEAMANVYKTEDDRRDTVLGIFKKHKMYIKRTSIGKFGTDGDLSRGKFKILIFEFKNEVGATGAELFFQAILYYLAAKRTFAGQYRNSVLPCIIVIIFGALSLITGSFYLIPLRPLHRICQLFAPLLTSQDTRTITLLLSFIYGLLLRACDYAFVTYTFLSALFPFFPQLSSSS